MINNNYGQIVDEKLQYAPYPLETDSGQVFTQDAAIYAEHGYLPISRTNPGKPQEGYHYEQEGWLTDEYGIYPKWVEVINPPEEPDIDKQVADLREQLELTQEALDELLMGMI